MTMNEADPDTGYTSAHYDWVKNVLNLGYWENGQKHYEKIRFPQYFYIHSDDVKILQSDRQIARVIDRVKKCRKGNYHRVYHSARWSDRDKIRELFKRKKIKPLEFDVDPVTRYMTEHPIKFARPKLLFFDIETDSRYGMYAGKNGLVPHPDARILSIAWRHSDDDETKFCALDRTISDSLDDPDSPVANAGERQIISDFMTDVKRSDLLIAWNGDRFDEPKLKQRCEHVGLKFDWRTVEFLDLLQMFKHPYYGYGRDSDGTGVHISYSLDNVARTTLGMSKIDDIDGHKIFDAWKSNFELFRRYNIRDVDIMVALEERYSYIATHTILANICNRFPSSKTVTRSTYIGDGLLLWFGAKNGHRFDSKPINVGVSDDQYEGALILEPDVGYHTNVCCVDVGSLYPNLIRTFNISPETLDPNGDIICANGARFGSDKRGILPMILDLTISERLKYKTHLKQLEKDGHDDTHEYRVMRQKSDAWKVASNQLYGLCGSRFSRIYNVECAEAVTVTGKQWVLQRAIDCANDNGINVVYGDTDSLFLRCAPDRAKEFICEFAADMDEFVMVKHGSAGYIRLGLDAIYDRFIITTKKRYFAKKSNGNVDVKGLELVRSDGCIYSRDFQRTMMDYFLGSDNPSIDGADAIVRDWCNRLHNGVSLNMIKKTVTLTKQLAEYKSDNAHVRVAKKLVEMKRDVFPGMKIPYVVIDGSKSKPDVCHVDLCDGKYDAMYYWAKVVFPPVKRILDVIFQDEKNRWEYLAGLDPSAKQGMLFDDPCDIDIVDLHLSIGDDSKLLEKLYDICCRYVGEKRIRLHIPVDNDNTVVMKPFDVEGKGVNMCVEFIEDVETLFNHRVYYGADKWLGDKKI